MSNPLHYWFDSCLRLLGGRCGVIFFGIGKLGPDVVPVVGTEVATSDARTMQTLYCHTLLHGHTAHFPVTNCRSGYPQLLGKRFTPTNSAGNRINRVFMK